MATAVILQFPTARAPTARATTAGEERLAAALASLNAALDDQKTALRNWRFGIAELGVSVAGIGHSLIAYQASLDQVAGNVATLRAQTIQLEAFADAAIATGADNHSTDTTALVCE